MRVGDIDVIPVSDGWFHMPKEFFPGADWSGHEDLFDHALGYLDRMHDGGKPFFSIIMTTSNHKPFTFREGLEAFGTHRFELFAADMEQFAFGLDLFLHGKRTSVPR